MIINIRKLCASIRRESVEASAARNAAPTAKEEKKMNEDKNEIL